MQDRPENPEVETAQLTNEDVLNPLKHLTAAQFMALGGNAVVYVRTINGDALSKLMVDGDDLVDGAEFQLVVSADGSPLMVGDSREAVTEWLAERNYGVVSLH
jgi:hypothetical protein